MSWYFRWDGKTIKRVSTPTHTIPKGPLTESTSKAASLVINQGTLTEGGFTFYKTSYLNEEVNRTEPSIVIGLKCRPQLTFVKSSNVVFTKSNPKIKTIMK